MDIFDDWRYRWSTLCKIGTRWHVITGLETRGGTQWPIVRPLRRWSPRDVVRLPLHLWWEHKYW